MFKSLDLSVIVEFILMFYRDKPIDWLLDHILWVKVCNPEKDAVSRACTEAGGAVEPAASFRDCLVIVRPTGGDCCWLEEFVFSPCVTLPPQKHCDRQKANLRIRFKPSLFQHVGTHSSLAGKIQKLKVGGAALGRVEHSRAWAELRQGGGGQPRSHRAPVSLRHQDKDFGKHALRMEHVNPPAEVSTSLKTYQHFTLEKAYLHEDFFWAFTPSAGDFIRFRFFQPLRLERSVPAPTDPLWGRGRVATAVQASPQLSDPTDSPL